MNHILNENKLHLCNFDYELNYTLYTDLWLISTYNTMSIDRGGVRTIIISNLL